MIADRCGFSAKAIRLAGIAVPRLNILNVGQPTEDLRLTGRRQADSLRIRTRCLSAAHVPVVRETARRPRADGLEVGHDIQVIFDVPNDWTLPALACQELLDVLTAVARRASGTRDERVAG